MSSTKVLDPAFQGAGQKVGLEIWRIEDFKPVPLPKSDYGKFYSGDSYVVLQTTSPKGGAYLYDLHFWIGKDSSQDEAGTAAIKTVELDSVLGGRAVQYRELQGYESDKFLTYFKPCIIPMEGGFASGFRTPEEETFEIRLYICKGKKAIRIKQVPFARSSLNHDDVFILDTEKKIYQFNGANSNIQERAKSLEVIQHLKEKYHGGVCDVAIVDDGKLQAESDSGEFWVLFGGFAPIGKKTVSDDDVVLETTAPKLCSFMASDGEAKIKAILSTQFAAEVHSGRLQNFGLVRILNYTCNDVKTEKFLIITKCEVVCQALATEIKSEVKTEEPALETKPKEEAAVLSKPIGAAPAAIMLKPRHDVKSASQIVSEQRGNAAPAARLAMTRRVHPLISLNPYQGNWVIKVRVTSKGNLRSYRNARGEGHVFNVELTDEDGTQIQATMFNEAAKKFYPMFELGKVYYISKGSLRIANKQFKTVQNDYEMTLNETAVVEEAEGESFIPPVQYNFVKIDILGPYVGGRELVDIVGVVQSVSPTLSIRRKIDNESIPKRDIVVADDTNKTVIVTLWNDLATTVGEELLDMVDSAPIIAIKSLKVSDFQGVSVSTVGKSTLVINPELPETEKLRAWYESEGKGTSLASVGAGMGASNAGGLRSMYSDRVFLSHITSDPNLGQDKPVFFSLYANISHIKPDQTMWYRACTTCNKKVTEALGSGYWCEGCQKNYDGCLLRYIMVIKVSDPTGEAWLSLFNDQAERIVGCSADDLDRIRKEEGDDMFQLKLKEATWVPHLFRVSVAQNEYMGEKRQRITVRSESPVDFAAEARYQLEEIAKLTSS